MILNIIYYEYNIYYLLAKEIIYIYLLYKHIHIIHQLELYNT